MPVRPGAVATEANLNDTVPAAPPSAGKNVRWQASAPYPDPNNPTLQVRDVTAYYDTPYEIVCGFIGKLADGQQLYFADIRRALLFPQNIPDGRLRAKIAPGSDQVFTIKVNGATVATGTILSGQNLGSFSSSADILCGLDDYLEVFGPATADTTMDTVTLTLVGTRAVGQAGSGGATLKAITVSASGTVS